MAISHSKNCQKSTEFKNWLETRAGTLLWVYRQYIAMTYIALARQAWIYRNISESLGTLLWMRNELWSVLQHMTLFKYIAMLFWNPLLFVTFTKCWYDFFQRHLATFTFIQLWNWLVPSSWHCVLTSTFHFFLQLKPTHYLALNSEWNWAVKT